MKELKKMSLKTIENALTRSEMKSIMAGSGETNGYQCCSSGSCSTCRRYVPGSGIPYCSGGTVTACNV